MEKLLIVLGIFAVLGCNNSDDSIQIEKAGADSATILINAEKRGIDITTVTEINIGNITEWELPVSGRVSDTSTRWCKPWKHLKRMHAKSFVAKWNSTKGKEIKDYFVSCFKIVVYFKDGSSREFRACNQFIKENTKWAFDIKDKNYIEKLYDNGVANDGNAERSMIDMWADTAFVKIKSDDRSEFGNIEGNKDCWAGVKRAEKEAKKGRYTYTRIGTYRSAVDECEIFYCEYVKKTYGVTINSSSTGFSFMPWDCFYRKANMLVEEKFGRNFEERTYLEAEGLFAARDTP